MLFPLLAFAGMGLLTSWSGRTGGTLLVTGKLVSGHMKQKSMERDALLGFNPTRAKRMKIDEGLTYFEWSKEMMPKRMKRWAGTYVLTRIEYQRLRDAATNRKLELETKEEQSNVSPLEVLVEMKDLSELRLKDREILRQLGKN